MRAAHWRRRYHDLHNRTMEVARLGDPVPAVSTQVANLLVDLLGELNACVEELEDAEAKS